MADWSEEDEEMTTTELEEPGADIETRSLRSAELEIKRKEEMDKILRLRLGGYSYQQIADQMGVSPSAISQRITRYYANQQSETTEQLRQIENARLDRLQAAAWTTALNGDMKAMQMMLNIMNRRAAMNGLDAPKKIDVQASVKSDIHAAIDELEGIVLGEVIEAEVIEEALRDE